MSKKTIRIALGIIFIALCGIGCEQKKVLDNLDQRQAIQALVVLHRHGVVAEKEEQTSGRSTKYRIVVRSDDYIKANELIKEYGIPEASSDVLRDLLDSNSFIPPSPELAEVRLRVALSSQVERLLGGLPGVVEARVFVQRDGHEGDAFEKKVAKASAVIRYLPRNGAVPFDVNEARNLLANAVSQLAPENISLQLVPVTFLGEALPFGTAGDGSAPLVPLVKVQPFPLKSFHIAQADLEHVSWDLGCLLLIVGILSMIVGYWLGKNRGQTLRKTRSEVAGIEKNESYFLERAVSKKDDDQENLPDELRF